MVNKYFLPVLTFLLLFNTISFAEESVISDILICPGNVFDLSDPTQRNFLFTLANKLHITTRPLFLKRLLLIKKGDPCNPFLLYESERLLRDFEFIRLASIKSVDNGAGQKTLNLSTRDAWSTLPDVSYGTKGGVETWSVGVKEKNFLGLGKTLAGYYRKELDRTYREFYYEDPALMFTRFKLGLNFQQDGEKKSHIQYLSYPFFSSITPWNMIVSEKRIRKSITLYENGEEYASWYRDRQEINAGVGMSIGSTPRLIRRVRASCYKLDETLDAEYNNKPTQIAEDKKMTAACVSLELKQLLYYSMEYVNTFDRTEDFNTGNELIMKYGYAPENWDADRTRKIFTVSEQKGWKTAHHAVFFNASSEGRIEDNKGRNVINFYHIYHYSKITPRQTLVSSINFEHGINLDPEDQIILGGASGLRGYSVRQFTGNKKLLFNIEYRSFWVDDFLHLVSLGGILFFDTGYNWPEHERIAFHNLRSDVGFGLRFDPTRGRGATPFNVSVAYALNKNYEDTRWVLTISGLPDILNTIPKTDERIPTP